MTNGSRRITALAGGNVGIGTATPDKPLHVYDSNSNVARFESSTNDVKIMLADNTDYVYIGHDASSDIMQLGLMKTCLTLTVVILQ